MSECKNCGREDGHWIGCAKAPSEPSAEALADAPEITDDMSEVCAFDDCRSPRRLGDKRVKYCEEHSDPKNRK